MRLDTPPTSKRPMPATPAVLQWRSNGSKRVYVHLWLWLHTETWVGNACCGPGCPRVRTEHRPASRARQGLNDGQHWTTLAAGQAPNLDVSVPTQLDATHRPTAALARGCCMDTRSREGRARASAFPPARLAQGPVTGELGLCKDRCVQLHQDHSISSARTRTGHLV